MTYLRTPAESPLYEADLAELGYVANQTRVMAMVPQVRAAWIALGGAISAGMDQRRYELVTLAAARRIGARYCVLAHAEVLRTRFYDDDTLRAIMTDHHRAGLDPVDVAIMDFAERIALDPIVATEADVEPLRAHGLTDQEILHIVLAVSARRFYGGLLNAVAAVPDAVYEKTAAGEQAAATQP